jgi:hypothetical protein
MANNSGIPTQAVMSNLFAKKNRLSSIIVFTAMLLFIAWQTTRLLVNSAPPLQQSSGDGCLVEVQGNVLRPGVYRVTEGITHFELLKVAGIRPTSDISGFNLLQQISGDQQLEVGTMPNPISIKKQDDANRIEFFIGQMSIISADGKSRPVEGGVEISAGDRIISEEKSQAEISINRFSRIDLDEYSECVFEKTNEEKNKKVNALFQKSGICWYKIVYSTKSEVFKTITPIVNVTVAGSGADFMINVKQDEIDIHDMDGLLLVERIAGGEAINMISGQSAVIFNDNRPFQVSQLSGGVNPADQFSNLTKAKTDFITRRMPVNFLFCAVPSVYYLISVQFENGTIVAVHIPGSISIEELVQGCATLDQAFLYGGAVFVSTLIEQIIGAHIPKYAVFTKDNVVRAAATFGGVKVEVDEKAASALKVPRGVQNLNHEQILKFLKPNLSGTTDFEMRQIRAIKAVFEGLKSKNIVLTALLTEQILADMETNFTSVEVMNHYAKFTETKNWTFKERVLPIKKVVQNGKSRDDPNMEESKLLLQN